MRSPQNNKLPLPYNYVSLAVAGRQAGMVYFWKDGRKRKLRGVREGDRVPLSDAGFDFRIEK